MTLFAIEFIGGLAHLARALAWQARGGRFESDILHKKLPLLGGFFFEIKIICDLKLKLQLIHFSKLRQKFLMQKKAITKL